MSDEKTAETESKETKKEKKKGRLKAVWTEFKAFISKGNVLDMAVGVIIGSAFSTIVTAVTNILLAVCTWGVPGGLSGLITVLPIMSSDQVVPSDILVNGQALQQIYTSSEWAALSQSEDFTSVISDMYTAYGGSYYYNKMAIIDWGSLINAIISFIIIALTLFIILKVYTSLKKRREQLKLELEKYKESNEEIEAAPETEEPKEDAPTEPEAPTKTEVELLQEIKDELMKLNSASSPNTETTD